MPNRPKPPPRPKPVVEPLMPANWDAPQEFRDRLGNSPGRQRLMRSEGHLLLVLHSPPEPDNPCRIGRLFWRKPDGTWSPQSLKRGEPPISELLGEYEKAAAAIDEIDDDDSTTEDEYEILTRVAPLLRSAHNLQAVLQEARQAVKSDRGLILLRDRADALVLRLELVQQDAQHGLDFAVARHTEEQAHAADRHAKAAHRLNLLVATFFPLATIAAVAGMNVRNGLEPYDQGGPPLAMFALIGLGLLLGVGLSAFLSRP